MENDTKELSLKEKVDMILNKKEEPEKEEDKSKKWKLPFFRAMKFKVGKKKVEKGWAKFIIIKSNRVIELTKAQVKDGIAIIDGFPRISTADHTLFHDKTPTYIIPEWNLTPFSPESNNAEAERMKTSIAGRRAVLATLETEKIKTKKDMGGLVWIVLIIIAIGGIYYFGKNSGWF